MTTQKRVRKPHPKTPTKQAVIEARKRAKKTVSQAAELVYVTARAWQLYEADEAKMHPAAFELFKIKTGQF